MAGLQNNKTCDTKSCLEKHPLLCLPQNLRRNLLEKIKKEEEVDCFPDQLDLNSAGAGVVGEPCGGFRNHRSEAQQS